MATAFSAFKPAGAFGAATTSGFGGSATNSFGAPAVDPRKMVDDIAGRQKAVAASISEVKKTEQALQTTTREALAKYEQMNTAELANSVNSSELTPYATALANRLTIISDAFAPSSSRTREDPVAKFWECSAGHVLEQMQELEGRIDGIKSYAETSKQVSDPEVLRRKLISLLQHETDALNMLQQRVSQLNLIG